MTIQGAIADLQYLLKADDVPFYYKGGIEKIIETIQMELADRKTEPTISKMEQVDKDINVRSKEPQTVVRLKHFKCPKCGRSDYIRSFEDWGIDGGIYKYKCINCNTYIKDEPQAEREGE